MNFTYSKPWHRVITEDKLNPSIIRVLMLLGRRRKDFKRVLTQLYEDSFIYGYRAGTTSNVWTEHGKQDICSTLKVLQEVYDFVNRFDWKKKPEIQKRNAWDFYRIAKYSLFEKSFRDILGTIDDIFEISTFYKFKANNVAPSEYQVENLYSIQSILKKLVFKLHWLFETENKEYGNRWKGRGKRTKLQLYLNKYQV
jgi:hypothetical protein